MCGGLEAYERALRERRVPRDRDVGLRLGRDPAARRRSSGSARSRTSSRSCSAPPAGATSATRASSCRRSYWAEARVDHAAGRLDRRPPEAAAPAAPAGSTASTGRSAGPPSTPRRAARCSRARTSTSSPSSAGATRATSLATSRYARRILRDARSTRWSAPAPRSRCPFFALGRARGLRCHYIESAARSDGPSMTGRLIAPHPRREPLRAVPGAGPAAAGSYRGVGLRLVRAGDAASAARAEIRKAVVTLGHLQGYRLPAAASSGCSRSFRPTPRCSGRPATPTSRGLGIEGHHALPERELTDAMARGRRRRRPRRRRHGAGRAGGRQLPGARPAPPRPRRARRRPPDPDRRRALRRGLAVTADADQLTLDHLTTAAATRVAALAEDPPFLLAGGPRAHPPFWGPPPCSRDTEKPAPSVLRGHTEVARVRAEERAMTDQPLSTLAEPDVEADAEPDGAAASIGRRAGRGLGWALRARWSSRPGRSSSAW